MTMTNSFIPVNVKAKLSVDTQSIIKNIEENIKNIPAWFDRLFYPNGYEAVILSAGESLEKYVEMTQLKERMEDPNRGFVTFCVKHSLPRLLKKGIVPDFCVILDARPLDEDSTHGFNRKELFAEIPEKTIFLVASMAHPDYAKHLQERGARVMGWHTEVDGLQEFMGQINAPVISGGTSSGVRAVSLAHSLGIRDVTLIGFDSCYSKPTKEQLELKDSKGHPKIRPVDFPVNNIPTDLFKEVEKAHGEINDKLKEYRLVFNGEVMSRFYTSGELLAQAQDFEQLFTAQNWDTNFHVLDDGIVSHMFRNMKRHKRDFSFVHFFSNTVPQNQDDSEIDFEVELKEKL